MDQSDSPRRRRLVHRIGPKGFFCALRAIDPILTKASWPVNTFPGTGCQISRGDERGMSTRQRTSANDIVLKTLGILLLAAVVLKGHEPLTVPAVNKNLWSWRPFLVFPVELQLVMGIWLLSGIFKQLGWLAALSCFSPFCSVTVCKALPVPPPAAVLAEFTSPPGSPCFWSDCRQRLPSVVLSRPPRVDHRPGAAGVADSQVHPYHRSVKQWYHRSTVHGSDLPSRQVTRNIQMETVSNPSRAKAEGTIADTGGSHADNLSRSCSRWKSPH